jgi:hypothetical protein
MPYYVLMGVPKIAQATAMSCWFAAGQMIRNVFTCGPLAGMLASNVVDFAAGLAPERFENFRQENGFDSLLASEPNIVDDAGKVHHQNGFTAENIVYLLRQYGPIWWTLDWGANYHVVVVVGVERIENGYNVVYHDPADGEAGRMLLGRRTTPESFNHRCLFNQHPSSMLHFPRVNDHRAPMMSVLAIENGF